MKRRDLLAMLGAGVAWPCVGVAQSNQRRFMLGVLSNEAWPPLEGLRDGMLGLGYVEGQTLHFERRFAEGRAERFPALAAELVGLAPNAIVTWATPATLAVKQATASIPIVAVMGDPLAVGLVASLAHPGANVTGLSTQAADLEGKRVELLKELVTNLARIVVLSNPANPYCLVAVERARLAAKSFGLEFDVVEMTQEPDVDQAFIAFGRKRPDAILVVADPFLTSQRARIAAFVVANRLPSVHTYREDVLAGGLICYATNYYDLFRRAATLTDKIFKGARPGDLPVEQPTKFELVVNLKTAKAIGLTMPQSVLLRADEVIE